MAALSIEGDHTGSPLQRIVSSNPPHEEPQEKGRIEGNHEIIVDAVRDPFGGRSD
jgi:hypothetical protein